jgi:hypothetical protein
MLIPAALLLAFLGSNCDSVAAEALEPTTIEVQIHFSEDALDPAYFTDDL